MAPRKPISSPFGPTSAPDLALSKKHGGLIAGVDEAGRGPLAGPVVAAAVIFEGSCPEGVNDSKKLNAAVRESLFAQILSSAYVGIGIACVDTIDRLNIHQATHKAMGEALDQLAVRPAAALIDGKHCPKIEIPTQALIGGDALSVSIAAASIIAKVTRDRLMLELDAAFPVYGWSRNKGYGTAEHLEALKAHGICVHHRRSFRPIADYVAAA